MKTSLIIAILSLSLSSIYAQTETASVDDSVLAEATDAVKVKKNDLDLKGDFSIEESVRKQKLAVALKHEIIKMIEYPESSENENTQGTVVVEFHLLSNGKIDSKKILKSLKPEFDAAVLNSIDNLVVDVTLLELLNKKYEKIQIPIRFMVQ